MAFHKYNLPYSAYDYFQSLAPEGSYRCLPPSALSGLISNDLLQKTNSINLMVSGLRQGTIAVANLNRIDTPASAVDQQPYGIFFDHELATAYGGFLDHGNWSGRTTKLSQQHFDAIRTSGTGVNLPLSEMPTTPSGLLCDLSIPSQHAAFGNTFSALQANI